MQDCINVGHQKRCGMKIYLISQKCMKSITFTVIFILIIVNIINMFLYFKEICRTTRDL